VGETGIAIDRKQRRKFREVFVEGEKEKEDVKKMRMCERNIEGSFRENVVLDRQGEKRGVVPLLSLCSTCQREKV
jgi:hypothetical protein